MAYLAVLLLDKVKFKEWQKHEKQKSWNLEKVAD